MAFAVFLDAALKVSALLLVVLAVAAALRRASAATRHVLWAAALSAVLVLPFLSVAIPWRLTVPVSRQAIATWLPTWSEPGRDVGATAPVPVVSHAGEAAPHGADAPATASGIGKGTRAGRLGLLPLLGVVWLTGVALVLLRLGIAWAVVDRLTRRSTSLLADDRWRPVFESVTRRLGVHRAVRLVSHPSTPIPFTAGFFRPVIVLPAAAASWTEDRRRAVLLHEVAHLRRADLVPQLVAQAATALHWFNPLVWIAVRRLRAESERACDDMVLGVGTKPSQYARHLLEIVARAGRSWAPAIALPMAQQSEFEGRVLAILEANARRHGPTRPMSVAVALVVALSAVPLASITPTGHEQGEVATARAGLFGWRSRSLIRSLSSPQAEARRSAARALGEREDAAAVAALARALGSDSDAAVRRAAAWALRKIEDPAAADALARALGDEDSAVRYEAARAIAEIGLEAAPPALLGALRDGDPRVRRAAARAVGEIEDPTTVEPLAQLLRDSDPRVRRAAVDALADVETTAAYDVLRAAREHDDPTVRRLAAEALEEEWK